MQKQVSHKGQVGSLTLTRHGVEFFPNDNHKAQGVVHPGNDTSKVGTNAKEVKVAKLQLAFEKSLGAEKTKLIIFAFPARQELLNTHTDTNGHPEQRKIASVTVGASPSGGNAGSFVPPSDNEKHSWSFRASELQTIDHRGQDADGER